MKLPGLAALNRPAERSWRDPANRSAEQLRILATHRRTNPSFLRDWALSDEELKNIYVDNNAALIANFGVEQPGPYSHYHTVQYLGGACLHHGWSIVPQDRPGTSGAPDEGQTRKPSRIPHTYSSKGKTKTIWQPFLPTKWRETRMTLRQFVGLDELLGANLAVQCCAASEHVRVIDIDCRDPDVAMHMREMAFRHLGRTPFIRIGAWPKAQLLYRVEDTEDIGIGKWQVTLGDPDGNDDLDGDGQPRNVVEYLAEGSIFTAYGLHHLTGKDFDWTQGTLHPAAAGPEHAPVITKAMMRAFVNTVQAYRPVVSKKNGASSNPYGGPSVVTEFSEKLDQHGRRLWIPKVSAGSWTINADGKVIDGAEAWLTAQVWAALAANADNLDAFADIQDAVVSEAKRRLLGVGRRKAELSTDAAIVRSVAAKIKRALPKWRDSMAAKARGGSYHHGVVPWIVSDDGRRPIPRRIRSVLPEDGSLDWLPSDTCPVDALSDIQPRARVMNIKKTAERIAIDKAARALVDTQERRKTIGETVSRAVREHIRSWLSDSVRPHLTHRSQMPQSPWVLRAPTGAGKTVSVIAELADFCRDNPRQPDDGPILLVLPTHANADEAIATAERNGMVVPGMIESEVRKLVEAGRQIGVRIARFRGREAAGCQRSAELRALSDKGIRATGLCEARVEDGDAIDAKRASEEGRKLPHKTVQCSFRERGECGYYRQFAELDEADVVIVAHAYLTMNSLPKALKNPRAVIVDESTTYVLLQQLRFPLSALNAARNRPYVLELDRKLNPGATDQAIAEAMVQDREELCTLTTKWFLDGLDVATELMQHSRCDDLLMSAIRVCDRSHTLDRRVRPDLTAAQVVTLSEEPVGRHLISEVRFWKTVRERIANIRAGTARGKHDARWQLVMDWETRVDDDGDKSVERTPHIRLSWRRGPNWSGAPMLLLDASANPRIIEKIYGARPEIRDVPAPLHVRTVAMVERTWANSSFIPRPDSTTEEIKRIGETISEARRLITTMAVLHGHGRVLVGTTIAVRDVLTGGWAPPPNVDFVHYGALRGLDFAKGHAAAISIGRSEQPIGVVDGYVGALSFDDDTPEEPYDILGTGLTKEGKVLFRKLDWRTIPMRSGQDVEHLLPTMRGKPVLDEAGKPVTGENGKSVMLRSWAQDLEESWREEELKQFVGRLRPVYRGVGDDLPPPIWLAVGKILPRDIIVDELLEMQSMVRISSMAELVRLGGGVLADNVTPRLPNAQQILQGRDLAAMQKAVLPHDKRFLDRFAAAFQAIGYEIASEPGRRRLALVLPGWIEGKPADAWLALSERHGEMPQDFVEKPVKLMAPGAKKKPADKRDIARDDQIVQEARIAHLHRELDAKLSRAEFEVRFARGDYLTKALGEAAPTG